MVNIPYLINDLIECKFNLQNWLNNRYRRPGWVPICHKDIASFTTVDGCIFNCHEAMFIYTLTIPCEYHYTDIKRDDIVIDLGANIGGFCIRAAKKSDYVYAVEPIFTDELRKNILQNNVNITVLETAIGDGTPQSVNYMIGEKVVPTISFKELLSQCNGCDFLKCDIEGGEAFIDPNDLKDIRRIEMEFHFKTPLKTPNTLIEWLKNNYHYSIDSSSTESAIFHGIKPDS